MIELKTFAIAALTVAVLSGSAGYWLGETVQAKETTRIQAAFDEARQVAAEEYTQAINDAREKEQSWQATAQESEKRSNDLKKKLDDAVRAAAIADGRVREQSSNLTDALNRLAARSNASGNRDTERAAIVARECVERASSLSGRLVEVAEQHDRCEIERRTLIGAWPK